MKLYYSTGTCSLFPHIVANEAGIALELEQVDIFKMPRRTARGADYSAINPSLYVPALELDDGAVLTEGAAIAQYLSDLKPAAGLMPAAGTHERYRVLSWLNFIATELHKVYSPWLFHAEYGEQAQDVARGRIGVRLGLVEKQLAANGPFLLGEAFGVADAYLFTIVDWSGYAKVDLSGFPKLRAFLDRVAARPAVQAAQHAEGLKVAA